MPPWAIVLITLSSIVALLIVILVAGLIYIGTVGPETHIYAGNQIPAAYVKTIESLGLLEPDENIRFLYSDAIADIKNGMYFVTDKHLVLYSADWPKPSVIIEYKNIIAVEATWSDEWIEDTAVTVELANGEVFFFPLSMENGTDHRFVKTLCNRANLPIPPQ